MFLIKRFLNLFVDSVFNLTFLGKVFVYLSVAMEDNSFIAHVFSNDSMTIHPRNTMSCFTSEFDKELDLGNDAWEVGIKKMSLSPANTTGEMHFKGRDLVLLPNEPRVFHDLLSFIDYALENSTDANLYTPSYFSKYLDKGVLYEFEVLDRFFHDDFVMVDEKNDTIVKVHYQMQQLLSENELNSLVHPKHLDKINMKQKIFTLQIPVNKAPFTFRQIIQLFIRSFVYQYTGSGDKSNFSRSFLDAIVVYNGYQEMMESLKNHRITGNKMVHLLIAKFVDGVKNSKNFDSAVKTTFSEMIFIYCDIIKSQLVGGKRAKLLLITPFVDSNVYFHVNYSKVEYIPVEKKKIKNLQFELRNENGEFIDFHGSSTPNHITLLFRRVFRK